MINQNRKKLLDYIETVKIHKVRCEICMKEEEEMHSDLHSVTTLDFAKNLHAEGWREIESEEYEMICICCPDCVEEQTQVKGKLTKS